MNSPLLHAVVMVAAGGAVGAVIRHLVDRAVSTRATGDYPWGILLVNVVGSFLLGLLAPVAPPALMLVAGVGLCGALTTYSTVAANVWGLLQQGRVGRAAIVLTVTVAAAVVAAAAGTALTSAAL